MPREAPWMESIRPTKRESFGTAMLTVRVS
jgi:hypothetical protein